MDVRGGGLSPRPLVVHGRKRESQRRHMKCMRQTHTIQVLHYMYYSTTMIRLTLQDPVLKCNSMAENNCAVRVHSIPPNVLHR